MRPWATKDIEGEHVVAAAGREYDAWRTWFIANLNFTSGDQQAGDGIDSVVDPLDMPFLYSLCCDLADGFDVHRVPMYAVERTDAEGKVVDLWASVGDFAKQWAEQRAKDMAGLAGITGAKDSFRVVTGEFVYAKDGR